MPRPPSLQIRIPSILAHAAMSELLRFLCITLGLDYDRCTKPLVRGYISSENLLATPSLYCTVCVLLTKHQILELKSDVNLMQEVCKSGLG